MRILAGEFGGRRILSPPGRDTTRPMTGAAKKSLFDILRDHLVGSAVVDLYCGTGTLGLEALSRGARRCAFADRDRHVLGLLRRNLADLGVAERCTVWQGDIPARLPAWLAGWEGEVDVAFVDPPFAATRGKDWPAESERIFAAVAPKLADEGLVVLRLPGKDEGPASLGGLLRTRSRSYGAMTVTLYAAECRRET